MQAPNFRVDGKRALVTGGSRGIGFATAFALAHAGAQVVIASRDEDTLKLAQSKLQSQGLSVDISPLDVTDDEAVRQLFASHEPFQIVVNNAGGNRPGPLLSMSDDDIDLVLKLNVKSTLMVSREAIGGMISAGRGGSIINLSSQYGYIGAPERTIYSAAKHGVEGLTKSLAWEVGQYGIRVNAVAPSLIETDMTRARLADPAVRAKLAGLSALNRVGQPEDMTGAILFLASDASSYITGTAIRIDGGTTAV